MFSFALQKEVPAELNGQERQVEVETIKGDFSDPNRKFSLLQITVET